MENIPRKETQTQRESTAIAGENQSHKIEMF